MRPLRVNISVLFVAAERAPRLRGRRRRRKLRVAHPS